MTERIEFRGFSRRDLIASTALIGAGLAAGPLLLSACANDREDLTNRSDNAIQTRRLGTLEVSELGAGCMSISANYGPPADRNQGIRPFARPTKKASRSSIPPRSTDRTRTKSLSAKRSRHSATRSPSPPSSGSTSKVPAAAEQPTRAHQEGGRGSLKRLRTDRIDLYYQHRVDPKVPIEDVAGAVKDLIGEGRCCTSVSPRRAREPSAARMPSNRWPQCRPSTRSWTRDPERNGVLDTCEELGIGFVPWGPVGMGYLTGKIDARTRFDPKTDLRSGFPASPRKPWRRTSRSSTADEPIRTRRRTRRLPRSRWHGCWRRSRSSFRSRARATSIT